MTLLNLVKEINHGELCLVKTPKKDTVILRGQVAKIRCRVNTGPLSQLTPVLFEVDENGHWAGGLQVSDNLLTVKAGKASKIEVEIRNTTKHDISLKGRTVLGRLQLIQSVTPVEVKLKTADTNPEYLQVRNQLMTSQRTKFEFAHPIICLLTLKKST